MNSRLPTNAQWFDALPSCVGCGKQAAGYLMNERNAKLCAVCLRCAKAAMKLRDPEAKRA